MIVRRLWLILATVLVGIAIFAQQGAQFPGSLLAGLRWRDVGPMRGGRTYGVAGHASQPDTFYFGSVGGGVWKTENSGRTWFPISDEGIPIGSIGAIAVAPSNANIVYVGTGEPDIRSQHSYGIGMYKSTDAGKTWTHIGLEATRQIGRVVVDPANANRVYVAALGHVYAANPDRGVYRSLDGGATWKKILFKTERSEQRRRNRSRASILRIRASLYASLWGTRRPPWSVYAPSNLPGRRPLQIHRWRRHLEATDRRPAHRSSSSERSASRFRPAIRIACGPWSMTRERRSFPHAAVAEDAAAPQNTGGGVYISDDAGATWKLVNSENRLWGRGWYFGSVSVDPANPDRAYVINTATYMTTDARQDLRARSKARPAATTITRCGSIPKTATAWC